jgi:hypothetical protein
MTVFIALLSCCENHHCVGGQFSGRKGEADVLFHSDQIEPLRFTTFVGRSARKSTTLAMIVSSSRCRASRVAQAMCGVIRQFRAASSGSSGRIGSWLTTSTAITLTQN